MLDKNILLQDYMKLGTLQLVANKYNITRERVRQLIAEFDKYKGAVSNKQIASRSKIALEYVKDGLTTPEIAERMGVSNSAVWRYCNYAGVKPLRRVVDIGCQLCRDVSYSRGLCRRCYTNWVRRGKGDGDLDEAIGRINSL